LVSLLLSVGGIAGVAVALSTEVSILNREFSANRGIAALMGVFAFVFGLCTWTGIELWRKKPAAFRWAQILLIAQIPSLSAPGFAYQFYTGLTLYLSLSTQPNVVTGFEFQLGSALRIQIFPEIEGFVLGLNLIAIMALYLLGKSR
jgi:hypothetical protein